MTLLIITIIIAFIIAFFIAIRRAAKNDKNKKNAEWTLNNLPSFKADNTYLSDTSGVSIAIDRTESKIGFIINKTAYIYNFSELLKCELLIDSAVVMEASLMDTAGRAALGNMVAGKTGAIIGGVTSTKSKSISENIDVKITVDDIDNPIFRVNFLNLKASTNSKEFKKRRDIAEKWHAIIASIIAKESKTSSDIG